MLDNTLYEHFSLEQIDLFTDHQSQGGFTLAYLYICLHCHHKYAHFCCIKTTRQPHYYSRLFVSYNSHFFKVHICTELQSKQLHSSTCGLKSTSSRGQIRDKLQTLHDNLKKSTKKNKNKIKMFFLVLRFLDKNPILYLPPAHIDDGTCDPTVWSPKVMIPQTLYKRHNSFCDITHWFLDSASHCIH